MQPAAALTRETPSDRPADHRCRPRPELPVRQQGTTADRSSRELSAPEWERKKQVRRPDDERDQCPEPPLPDVAEELAAGVAPETVISCHSPPEALSALPLA